MLRDAFEASASATENDTSRGDAFAKSLNEPRGTAVSDIKAKLGAVRFSLLDKTMSESSVCSPYFCRSVTVTRLICVGSVSKCKTLIFRVYAMEGRSQKSDKAIRSEALDPGGILNARELNTMLRSAGINTLGDMWNW